jgi:hypothetical protein
VAPPFDAVIRPVADIAASLGVPVLDAASEVGQATISQMADMSPPIAQSGLAAAASAFRYSRALTELLVRYQSSLIQAAADRASGRAAVSPAECRVLVDELRAFLRQAAMPPYRKPVACNRSLKSSASRSRAPPTRQRQLRITNNGRRVAHLG